MTRQRLTPGFAGGGFVARAGRGYAVAGCAPGVAHPAEQHTFSAAVHTPIGNKDRIPKYYIHVTKGK